MSFDRLAPYYRWMEFLLAGGKMHRCRTAFWGQIPTPKYILLLGEGHGRSLVEFRRRFADAQITCVDASAGMLIQARRQLTRHNLKLDRVEFIHADVLNWAPPPSRYDLVVTNFFLDCFRPNQLESIISKVAASTTSDASWLLADFQIPDVGSRRIRSRLILWLLYRFFRATARLPAHKLTKPDSLLEKAGFTIRRRIESEWGLLHSDWWRRETSPTLSK
jgi:ubiquinone/menaquinone biosynthesis C-methylase UbiE